jgi:hypothetical protein
MTSTGRAIAAALIIVTATLSTGAGQSSAVKPMTEREYAKAMRELHELDTRLRDNIEEVARADLERMLLFEATMSARNDAARMEEILADVVLFWEARRNKEALTYSRGALMEAANISKALAVIDLHSPSVATVAQTRLNKICSSCHAAHREKRPDGTYRIK